VRIEDRRNVLEPAQTVTVYADRIEVRRGGSDFTLPLGAVEEVRIALELAGASRQAVCRVKGGGREVVIGSQRAAGPGVYADNGEAFRRVVVALHEALRPRFAEVAFVRGQSRAFRWAMFWLGLLLAAVALALVAIFVVQGEGLALVVGTMPFALIGIALAVGFRPGHPPHYDPDSLIAEFSEPVDGSAASGDG
jgi:hypothetical protein